MLKIKDHISRSSKRTWKISAQSQGRIQVKISNCRVMKIKNHITTCGERTPSNHSAVLLYCDKFTMHMSWWSSLLQWWYRFDHRKEFCSWPEAFITNYQFILTLKKKKYIRSISQNILLLISSLHFVVIIDHLWILWKEEFDKLRSIDGIVAIMRTAPTGHSLNLAIAGRTQLLCTSKSSQIRRSDLMSVCYQTSQSMTNTMKSKLNILCRTSWITCLMPETFYFIIRILLWMI